MGIASSPAPLLISSLLMGILFASPVQALERALEVDGSTLVIAGADDEPTRIDLPCSPTSWIVEANVLYGACADEGVLVVELAGEDVPGSITLFPMEAHVEDVFIVRGQIWVQLTRIEARPFSPHTAARVTVMPSPTPVPGPTPTPTPATPAVESHPAPPGRVVGVNGAQVVIDLGQDAGLRRNDRVEIFIETTVDLGAGEVAQREESLAVGQVTTVTENRAQVALGMNERVPLDAFARPTQRPLTARMLAPARLGDIWEVRATLRPFLTLGTLGLGTISDLNVAYRFEAPWTIEAVINPLGIGYARDASIFALSANGVISYDTTLFKVGLGLGWSSLRERIYRDPALPAGGLSVAQTVRLGASDGLHLEVFNTFVLYHDEFHYSGTRAGLQVPTGLLTRRTWLVARGGGSSSGEGFGEIGLRVLATGDGDHGSLFLTPTLGGGGLFGVRDTECPPGYPDECRQESFFGGPMIGFGVEWRP